MTATAINAPDAPIVHMVPCDLIAEHKNTRTTFNEEKLQELADDLAKRGVLQPVLVRPLPPGSGEKTYELVYGARRLRGSKRAGLEYIPALVREMSDVEVLETQLVENAKREDISPIEEAEAYERLQKEHGYTVQDIAAQIGTSTSHVYARLKLCALIPEARAALATGKLTPSSALLVARVPPSMQKDAVEELAPYDDDDEPMGARAAFNRIHSRFMLQLDEAAWDLGDEQLVPAAGSCQACPKRTGNQPELFADVKAKDTCTDPTCFKAKKEAHWVQLRTKAEGEGRRIIEGKEAKKIVQYGNVSPDSGLIDLAAKHYADGAEMSKAKTYRALLGKAAPTPVLLRDERGDIRELVPFDEAAKVLETKGIKLVTRKEQKLDAKPKADTARVTAMHTAARAALVQMVVAAEKKDLDRGFWRAMVDHELDLGNPLDTILVRRGFVEPGVKLAPAEAEKRFRASLDKMNVGPLRGLYVELVLDESADFYRPDQERSIFARFAEAFKIDMKALVDAALAQGLTEAKPKPKAAPPPKAKAPKARAEAPAPKVKAKAKASAKKKGKGAK